MNKSKAKNITLWFVQVMLAIFFVVVAAPKLMGNPEVVENFRRWGMPENFYVVIGVLELLGGIGLLLPRLVVWASGGLILLMLGAAGTHIAHGEWSMLAMPVMPLLVLAAVGYARCPWWGQSERGNKSFTEAHN